MPSSVRYVDVSSGLSAQEHAGAFRAAARSRSGIALRPVEPATDTELLVAVYRSTRAAEFAPMPWSEQQRDEFIRTQFGAEDRYWRAQRPTARFDLILIDDDPAGRIYVDRLDGEIRIIDIALLPAFRGRGVGTALVLDLLEEASDRAVAVTIHVAQGNGARTLYDRLGFLQVGTAGVYDLLEWRPPGMAPAG
jgi:ribosomal protein S18 acetylase RimI-like enzyme